VTESSKDGMVTVTVDSAGNVTDLRITDQVREKSGSQVSAAVLNTLWRAQSRLPERLGEVMAGTIGDDKQTMETIVGNYRSQFPELPPESDGSDSGASENIQRVGVLEEDVSASPPARPQPKRSPAVDESDDGFGQAFMVRE
jgi:hypothetical protein